MLPTYDLIGKKISIWNGRINVLSGFLVALAHLMGYVLWFVVAGEWAAAAELAAWKAMLLVSSLSLIFTQLLSRLLYRPLPQDVIPDRAPHRSEGLITAFRAGLPYLEIDGASRISKRTKNSLKSTLSTGSQRGAV